MERHKRASIHNIASVVCASALIYLLGVFSLIWCTLVLLCSHRQGYSRLREQAGRHCLWSKKSCHSGLSKAGGQIEKCTIRWRICMLLWERGQVGTELDLAVWDRSEKCCFSLPLPQHANDSYPSLLCHCAQGWPKGFGEVSEVRLKKTP